MDKSKIRNVKYAFVWRKEWLQQQTTTTNDHCYPLLSFSINSNSKQMDIGQESRNFLFIHKIQIANSKALFARKSSSDGSWAGCFTRWACFKFFPLSLSLCCNFNSAFLVLLVLQRNSCELLVCIWENKVTGELLVKLSTCRPFYWTLKLLFFVIFVIVIFEP